MVNEFNYLLMFSIPITEVNGITMQQKRVPITEVIGYQYLNLQASHKAFHFYVHKNTNNTQCRAVT